MDFSIIPLAAFDPVWNASGALANLAGQAHAPELQFRIQQICNTEIREALQRRNLPIDIDTLRRVTEQPSIDFTHNNYVLDLGGVNERILFSIRVVVRTPPGRTGEKEMYCAEITRTDSKIRQLLTTGGTASPLVKRFLTDVESNSVQQLQQAMRLRGIQLNLAVLESHLMVFTIFRSDAIISAAEAQSVRIEIQEGLARFRKLVHVHNLSPRGALSATPYVSGSAYRTA